jgi:uncharacterized protein (DUF736 family)
MATIGAVTRRPDGSFLGKLEMKSYAGRTLFQPAGPKQNDNAPDFRIYGEGDRGGRFEMGAAWIKARTDGTGTYVSIKIDYPELPSPVYATLGVMAGQDDDDVFAVIWNRPVETRATGTDPFAGLGGRTTTLPVADPLDVFAPTETPSTTTRGRKGRGAAADVGASVLPDDDIPH